MAAKRHKYISVRTDAHLPRACRRLATAIRHLNFCAFLWPTCLVVFCPASEPTTLTGRAMGTTWSAKFFQPTTPLDPTAVSAQIAARLEALEAIFSTYRPTSELSRFNTAATTDWQSVSPELAQVAHASRDLSVETEGAFDATVAPLIYLWGFGPQRRIANALPTPAEVATARARVDYRRLEIRLLPPALRKLSTNLAADFSSLAKGFASDELSSLLTSLGAAHHLVQVGGDLRTAGDHPWCTGIENPIPPNSILASSTPLAAIVSLTGQALSTSGDTLNFIAIAGHRSGHLIDPRTGRPATSSLASVSVIARTCAESSSLATALFVLGPDAGYRFARAHQIAALFLARDGTQLTARSTPAFASFVTGPSAAPAALPLTAPVVR